MRENGEPVTYKEATPYNQNCTHESATGIDQNFGPDKVWRCDSCGYLYRTATIDADGILVVDRPAHIDGSVS